MLGLDVAETLEHRSGADQISELTPRDGAGLREEERRVAVLAGMRDGLFGEREDAIPVAALAAVGVAQIVERAFVLGIELDRLLEELRADVDVLVPGHPAGAEDMRHLRATLLVVLVSEDLRLDLLEVLELSRLAHRAFEERGGLLREWICGVRLLENVEDVVGREATRDARGAQQEAALRCVIGLVLRSFRELRDVRLPRAALGLHVLEVGARFGARAVARRERTRVRARRLVVVAEIAEHVAELDEERGRLRSILVRAQLQLEELLHHVQLAERPVHRASRFEALSQRWIQLVRVLKVLQRFHTREEFLLENLTEAQMEARLRFVGALGLDSLFELLD